VHLLLVEDGEINRELVQVVLEALGYRVDTACDDQEVVSFVQAQALTSCSWTWRCR